MEWTARAWWHARRPAQDHERPEHAMHDDLGRREINAVCRISCLMGRSGRWPYPAVPGPAGLALPLQGWSMLT